MPGKILGLDISEDSITAVQVKSGLKRFQVIACARVMVEGNDGLDDALRGLFDQMDFKSDLCLASIPGGHASYRNIQMPFRELKKIRKILPSEIETMVPFSIEDMLVDFAVTDRSDQKEILAVSVKKTYISKYLEALQAYGVDPDVLEIKCIPMVSWLLKQQGTPDNGLFLEIGEKSNTMVLYLKRRIALIRTFDFTGGPAPRVISDGMSSNGPDTRTSEQIESWFESFSTRVRNTVHAFGWQRNKVVYPEKIFFTGFGALYPEAGTLLNRFFDIPAEKIDLSRDKKVGMDEGIASVWDPLLMDSALALALRDPKQGQALNFRRDEFEIRKHYLGLKRKLRKAAVFFFVILSFLAADMGVDYYFLKKKYKMLDQKITAVFKQTLPGVKRIVDPVQQMKVKINEIKNSAGSIPALNSNEKVLDLIKDISQRVPGSLDVRLTRMVIDPEAMRISGKTDTFNTVDSIKNALNSSTKFSAVIITSANLDRTGKQVQFEIKLQRAK